MEVTVRNGIRTDKFLDPVINQVPVTTRPHHFNSFRLIACHLFSSSSSEPVGLNPDWLYTLLRDDRLTSAEEKKERGEKKSTKSGIYWHWSWKHFVAFALDLVA